MTTLNWRQWFPSKQEERTGLLVCWVCVLVLLSVTLAFSLISSKQLVSLIFLRLLMFPVWGLAVLVMAHLWLVGEERGISQAPLRAIVVGVGLFIVYLFVLALNDPEI